MTEYIELRIQLKDEFHELLIAELFDLDFEGFEEQDDLLIATISSHRFDDLKREEIEKLLFRFGDTYKILSEKILGERNWNEEWERTIQPQRIGSFYVHPTWSASPNSDEELIELIIDPKMAFGTGYHATTRLILQSLPKIVTKGDHILDAGTGTGILGIAGLKLGAESAFGFDIDEWSKTNTDENILLNEVSGFEVRLGSVEVIPDKMTYDTVLANINRNALIELLPELVGRCKIGGYILISGLLAEDEQVMLKQDVVQKLDHIETRSELEWISMLFKK